MCVCFLADWTSNGSDVPDCFICPENKGCSWLHFTIHIDKNTTTENEMMNLPQISSNNRRNVTKACSNLCSLQKNLSTFPNYSERQLVIQMENMTLIDSKITVQNVFISFQNVHFVNSVVSDFQYTKDYFGHVILYFTNSKFENQTWGK